jgi:hypothetical protein
MQMSLPSAVESLRHPTANGAAEPSRVANILLVAVFPLMLCLPLVQMVFGILPDQESFENRQLAELPERPATREALLAFSKSFEDYFDDHFGFRNSLIRWNNQIRVQWLGAANVTSVATTPGPLAPRASVGSTDSEATGAERRDAGQAAANPAALVRRGKDGWLYSGGPLADEYVRSENFTPDQVAAWREVYEQRQRWLRARNIGYLVVICPTKETIYPEFQQGPSPPSGKPTRLDMLLQAMRERSSVPTLDLSEPLRSNGADLRTYHRTDTHWNEYGAYLGYREIVAALQQQLDIPDAWSIEDFEVRRRDSAGGDLAAIMGLAETLREESIELLPLRPRRALPPVPAWNRLARYPAQLTASRYGPWFEQHPDATLPTAVIFHDSFGFNLIPFLSEHFSKIAFYYYNLEFRASFVDEQQPQVVIDEIIERRLAGPPPKNPDEVAAFGAAEGRQ